MSHFPASDTDLKITAKRVRQALTLWDSPAQLGNAPLASLKAVANGLSRLNQDDTLINRGLVLKELLNGAIQSLRPSQADPQPLKREWRAYLENFRTVLLRPTARVDHGLPEYFVAYILS